MNAAYRRCIAEYVDSVDCSFEYTFNWFSQHGVDMHVHRMLYENISAPYSLLQCIDRSFQWPTFAVAANTPRKIDTVFNHWFTGREWKVVVGNPHITAEQWSQIIQTYKHNVDDGWWVDAPIPWEEFADTVQFPWEQHLDQVHDVSLVQHCTHILVPGATHNDAFWDPLYTYSASSSNPSLSAAFWKKNWEVLECDLACLLNPGLDESFWQWMIDEHLDRVSWTGLARHPTLSETFWNRYQHHLDGDGWSLLCLWNTSLSVTFWETHVALIEWWHLSMNPSIPASFWKQYLPQYKTDVHWEQLCTHPALPVSFWEETVQEYAQYIDWTALAVNQSLPLSFWSDHTDQPEVCANLFLNPYAVKQIMLVELEDSLDTDY
jgi:hypothetical protein